MAAVRNGTQSPHTNINALTDSQTDFFAGGPAQPNMFAERRSIPAYDPAAYKHDLAVVRADFI